MQVPVSRVLLACAVCFLGTLVAYLPTTAPQVTLVDSGEFILTARTLGTNHSPGYPLHSLLGRTMLFLPIGNDAFRMAVMSGVGGAVCAVLACLFVTGLTGSVVLGTAAGLLNSLGITFWNQATMAEVYCPALAFCILAVMLVLWPRLRFLPLPHLSLTQRMALYGLNLGLGVTFHQFIVFFQPGLLLAALLLEGRAALVPRRLSALVTMALVGFSVNLYLPLRAAQHVFYAWEQPDRLDRFLSLLSTSNFNAERFVRSWEQFQGFLFNFTDAVLDQFPVTILLLALVGVLVTWRREKAVFAALIPSLAIDYGFPTVYFNLSEKFYDDVRVFYVPGHWLVATLACLGLWGLRDWLTKQVEPRDALGFMAVLTGLLVGWTGARNLLVSDRSQEYFIHDWGRAHLHQTPTGGIKLVTADEGFVLWHLQQNHRLREDVALISADLLEERHPLRPRTGWYAEATQRNYPWIRIPDPGHRHEQIISLFTQQALLATFYEEEYGPWGLELTPWYPGFWILPAEVPVESAYFLESMRRFPLRNPPIHPWQRLHAERDYLDATLSSAVRAWMATPPSALRDAIKAEAIALDPRARTLMSE